MSVTIDPIAPDQLEELRRQNQPVALIDVRTPAEYRTQHAVGAENVPLDELRDARLRELVARGAGEPLYVICQSGTRAQKACGILAEAGAPQVVNVQGGTAAWTAAGLPTVRGKPTMALERQVRIAAGSLILVGVALAWLVHPAFVGLSAFIGAGLVFSGVTDTCGMGLVLAKMPWNRT